MNIVMLKGNYFDVMIAFKCITRQTNSEIIGQKDSQSKQTCFNHVAC